MSFVRLGDALPLNLLLEAGDTNLYPQAIVLNDANVPIVGSPFNLTHLSNGYYTNSAFNTFGPSRYYKAIYLVYDDPAHTQLSGIYAESSDFFEVINLKTSYDISVPEMLEIPTSGQKTYRFLIYIFDDYGEPIDPDSSQVFIHIEDINNGLILPLTAIQRDQVGVYWYKYTVNSTDSEQTLWVEFTYTHFGNSFVTGKATETTRIRAVLDILNNSKLTQARAQNLDFLDAAVSTRQSEISAANRYNTLSSNQTILAGLANTILSLIGSPFGGTLQSALDAIKFFTDRIGSPQGVSVSADLLSVLSQLSKLGSPASGTISSDLAALTNRLGSPVSGSISADIASVKADSNKLGIPVTGSVSGDIAAVQGKLGIPASSSISGDLQTLLGYNSVLTTRIGIPAGASLAVDISSLKQDSTSLLFRLSSQRAQLLDNIDVPVSSRESESAASARYSQLEAEHTSILAGIGSIPNNTTFVGIVPPTLVLPAVGTKTYKFYVNLFNADGTPGDPDSNVVSLRVMDLTANVLAGPMNMTQLGTGRYVFNYVVSASDIEQPLQVVFEYNKLGVFYQHRRLTEVQEFESKLDVLIQRITAQRASNLDNLTIPIVSLETENSAAARQTSLISQINQVLLAEAEINGKLGTPQSDLANEIGIALNQLNKIGNPVSGTLAGDLTLIAGYAQKIGFPVAGSLAAELALIEGRIGSPAGLSLASDLAAIKLDTTKLGTPTQGSISADIADVKSLMVAGGPLSNQISGVQSTLAQVNSKLGTPFNGSLSSDIAQLNTKIGAPLSGSIGSDLAMIEGQLPSIASILTKVNTIDTKIGSPVHGNIASDLANIGTLDIGNLQTDITSIKNIIGIPSLTLVDELNSILNLTNAIPTNALLSIDPRLNNLDATISSRATPGSVGSSGAGDGILDLVGIIDVDSSELELVGVVEE